MSLDLSLFKLINSWAGFSGILDFLGIFLAIYLPFIIVAAILVIIFLEKNWRQRWYDFFFVSASALLARGFLTPVIRLFYHRDRPFIAMPDEVIKLIDKSAEASFPSGHAILFFAIAMAVYFVRPKWAPYFFGGAIMVGLARVFVGVHYPIDILVGAILGILSAYAVHKLFPKLPAGKPPEII